MVPLMDAAVTSLAQPDLDLAALRHALAGSDATVLVLDYAGRTVQSGYHVTEIKAAQLSTLDCGGNPDHWTETILQVEDIPLAQGPQAVSVGKFLSILARVEASLTLDAASRVTIEMSRPDEAMQVFDIAGVVREKDRTRLSLAMRPAICKPRHRAARTEAPCCGSPSKAACCA
ncbi:DUF6428 family protein [Devosia sp. Naph2]|uniref:DUF6428 family protein n=1 Tax=Devosia polycyclovorans TaxID=3345148 RepID=UPI0035CFA138